MYNFCFFNILRIVPSFFVVVFLLCACDKNIDKQDELPTGNDNTIVNGDFEKKVDFNDENSAWKKECGKISTAKYEWLEGEGYNQSNCISLASESIDDDVALVQDIQLEGDKVYQLTAWVKTANVVGGKGANICLFGTWQSSEPLTGNANWQKLSLLFIAPGSGEVSVACRLGYWSSNSTGKAWFDDIQIQEVEMFDQKSEHIRLRLRMEDIEGIQPSTITNWLANLDKAYEKYYDLIGEYPFDGKIITIFSVDDYPGGWAVAGNPILWHQPHVRPTLLDIESKGDWSFGILHEMGHDFAPSIGFNYNNNWNWGEEFFANFRMYYVVELLNAHVYMDKLYIGSDLKNFYKTDSYYNYDNTICTGDTINAESGVTYTLIRVRDKIGWEPFKKTYQYLYHAETNLTTNWQRFNLFLDKLSDFSGEDVRQTFPEGELGIIEAAMALGDE